MQLMKSNSKSNPDRDAKQDKTEERLDAKSASFNPGGFLAQEVVAEYQWVVADPAALPQPSVTSEADRDSSNDAGTHEVLDFRSDFKNDFRDLD